VNKIRVLLGNHPLMVPDALRQMIADQDDMELVGDCRGPMRILQESGRANADVVILAQEGSEELGLCSQLLAMYPDLTILTVEPDLGNVFSQQLCSHRCGVHVGEHGDIVQWMRRLMRDPCSDERL
jgi:hypothetical protein